MSPLAIARGLVRRSRFLVEFARAARAWGPERDYVRRRERYARAAAGLFQPPGWEARARQLLGRRWPGPRRTVARARDARLFCAFPQFETASPIVPELQRNFDVTLLDIAPFIPPPAQRRDRTWRDHLQRRILDAFEAAEDGGLVDLALLYVSHFECAPETLLHIGRSGTLVAILSLDDKHAFEPAQVPYPNGLRPLVGAATLHLTSSLECLRWYLAEGAPAYFFPEGADPLLFPKLDVEKDIDVSFVGGWYGGRRTLVERLRALGIRVECFGPATENGVLPRERMAEIFNRSLVNLGFGGIGLSTRVTHLKGRDFEVPMSGNVYLTLYNHELSMLFRIGEEIACFLNEIDCAEQIRMFLEDDARAAAMGGAARERALRDHTWTRRVTDLLTWLGIVAPDHEPGANARR